MARSVALSTVKIEKGRRSRTVSPNPPAQEERERVLRALQKAGLLAEPTPEMHHAAEAYDACHSPAAQKRLLAELRSLRLKPSLSETILQNRE